MGHPEPKCAIDAPLRGSGHERFFTTNMIGGGNRRREGQVVSEEGRCLSVSGYRLSPVRRAVTGTTAWLRLDHRGLLMVESAPLPSSRLQPGPRTRRRFWFPKTPLTQGWGLDSGCGRKDWGIQLNDPGAQTRSKAAAQFVLQRKAVFPCPWRALDKRLAQVWRNRSWGF